MTPRLSPRRARQAAPLILLALAATRPAPVAAQQERAVFLARQGDDTLAVETMTRTGLRVEAVLRYRTPALVVAQSVTTSTTDMVERIATTVSRGGAADSVVQRATLTIAGDSARSHREPIAGAPSTPDLTLAVPRGIVPFLNLSGASLELVLRRARQAGGDSVSVPLLITGRAQPYLASVVRVAGTDSVLVRVGTTTLRVRSDGVGRLLGAVVPDQQLVIERLAGTSPVAHWAGIAEVSYAAPAGAPYITVEVAVPTPHGPLAGTLTLPRRAGAARLPAVVLVSGSGPQDRDESSPALPRWRPFRQMADTLARRGIATLRLDDRGVGRSAAGPAGATMLDEAADLRTVLAWLRARPEIDPARVALLGHSSGGEVAPMVAAGDARVRALVLISAPASRGREISAYQIRALFAGDTTLAPARRDSLLRVALQQADSAFAAGGWLQQFGDWDPLPTARKVRTPTLVLHGATDRQVPVADAARLAGALRAGGNRAVTLRVFPRLDHLLVDDPSGSPVHYDALPSFAVRADLLGALADWLAATLGARSPAP